MVGFSAPEFKTPSLPFTGTKSAADETVVAAQTQSSGQSHRITSSSSRHQSFFGGAHEQFSFDGPGDGNNNMDDDSGYYSSMSMSEQIENDDDGGARGGDQLATSMNRIQNRNGAAASAFRHPPSAGINMINPAVGNEEPGQQVARGGVNARAAIVNTNFDASFANLTKRNRPTSLEDNDDIVLVGGRSELSKRPCVRPSHNSSRRSSRDSLPPSSVTPVENVFRGETDTASLPHNAPHPTATIEGFPGLEFSEADMERYAELYEKGAERWSRSTMDEWLAGANDIMTKFTEIMDMVSHSRLPLVPVLVSVVFSFPCHPRSTATDQGAHEVRAQFHRPQQFANHAFNSTPSPPYRHQFQSKFIQVLAYKARERTLLSRTTFR